MAPGHAVLMFACFAGLLHTLVIASIPHHFSIAANLQMKLLVVLFATVALATEPALKDPETILEEPLIREAASEDNLDQWAKENFNQTWASLFQGEPNDF